MTNTLEEVNDNDFVLKHRIAGAAFLLFFGALVLPWLLGSPSQADKPKLIEITQTGQSDSTISKDLESQILAELQDSLRDDEQVYISKITPAGQPNKVTITKVNKPAPESKSNDLKLAKEKLAKEKLAKEKLAKEKLAKERLAKSTLEKQKLAKEKLAKSSAKLNAKVTTGDAESASSKTAAADLAAALAAESSKQSAVITSGWVVQVGMFVDKKKADNVYEALGIESNEEDEFRQKKLKL